MASRINDDDIALVRERAHIEDIVRDYVTLRNAGGGSFKGLCPFHDEKTPSFHVTPARGFYHCFGCGEGGDVIDFVRKIENMSFVEAITFLADKTGVHLRISDDGRTGTPPGQRQQILAANEAAAEFYASQILSPEAIIFRQFVDGRGFDRQACEHFSMGYAPRGGKELHYHLNRKGFSDELLIIAGLIRPAGWDYFQGRVIWPIKDAGRHVLGFGARRVYDDDRMPAKYLNTPETSVYKKSHVLYGLDLARQAIGAKHQAVIVEGYTDVMAAHLSGITTAVASCGTAFGADHAKGIQRLLGDGQGEVIFTFDGDEAGQQAAMKVFTLDNSFTSQTYAAVDAEGRDPCDIRLESGENAVRHLIDTRIPLYRFVMARRLSQYDLDRADARVAAIRANASLISSVRDTATSEGFIKELASMVGVDIDETRRIVAATPRDYHAPSPQPAPPPAYPHPHELPVERDTLKLMVQHPTLFDTEWDGITEKDFTHPGYRALFRVIAATPYGDDWRTRLRQRFSHELLDTLYTELVVEPLVRLPDQAYASAYAAKLQALTMSRRVKDMRSALSREQDPTASAELTRELTELLSQLRELQRRSM